MRLKKQKLHMHNDDFTFFLLDITKVIRAQKLDLCNNDFTIFLDITKVTHTQKLYIH